MNPLTDINYMDWIEKICIWLYSQRIIILILSLYTMCGAYFIYNGYINIIIANVYESELFSKPIDQFIATVLMITALYGLLVFITLSLFCGRMRQKQAM